VFGDARGVVRVMHARPAAGLDVGHAHAGVIEPALVEPEDRAVAVGHPGELGDVVGERAEALAALADRLLDLLALRHVGERHDRAVEDPLVLDRRGGVLDGKLVPSARKKSSSSMRQPTPVRIVR
jgi:hypothetical protein